MTNEATTRRHFLRSTAAPLLVGSAAAAFALPRRARAAGAFTDRIRKAVKYHMVAGSQPAEDKLRMLRDLGFDGVEARAMLKSSQSGEVQALKRASEKLDFPIHGLTHSSNPTLIEAIDQAVELGANSVLHVVRTDRNADYLKNYADTQAVIRRAIDHAEKKQVYILLENVWASFLIEPLTMARYIDELESPYVQSYFDVGNVVRWGWPQHWIQVLGSRIKKLDIKEYNLDVAMDEGMRNGFNHPLGEGSIDWAKVRHELLQIDYRGWATAEVRGGDRQRLADIAEQMDRVLGL